MAPKNKKEASKQEKHQQAAQASPSRLTAKRRIKSEDDTTEEDYLRYLAQCFDDQSHKQQGKQDTQRSSQSIAAQLNQGVDFDEEECESQKQCQLCLSDELGEGRYILSCRHMLCNECFIYWSNIDSDCPLCYCRCTSVLMVLGKASRVTEIRPKFVLQPCQECHSSNNPQQMYYCDSCEVRCVHLYCRPELMLHPDNSLWYCQNCSQQQNRQRPQHKKEKRTTYSAELSKWEGQSSNLESEPASRSRSKDLLGDKLINPKRKTKKTNRPGQ